MIEKKELLYTLAFICIIIILTGGLFWIYNQFIVYTYHLKEIGNPCSICKDVVTKQNEYAGVCIDKCLQVSTTIYPMPNGDLMDNFGNCYTIDGKKIKCKSSFGLNITFNQS